MESPDDPGDTVDRLAVGLVYGRRTERLGLSVYGRFSGNRFRTLDQFSRLSYGGGFGLSYRASRTASVRFGQSGTSGFYTPFLLGLGLQLPQVRVDALQTTMLGTWQATPRTTLKLDSDFGYMRYRSDRSRLDPAQIPVTPLTIVGLAPPEEAAIGLTGLPTPVDASLVALSALASEGVTTERLNLLTYHTGMQISQGINPRTAGSLQFGYRALDYGAEGISPGGQLDVGASIRRELGSAANATLQYTYQKNTAQRPSVSTKTVQLQVERELGSHLKAHVSLGLGRISAAGATPTESSFLGGAGLSGRYRRTRWGVHYGRTTFQAFGFGRNYFTDSASAYLDHTFAKRFAGRLDALYRHSQDVFGRQYVFSAAAYSASARFRIQRRTSAEVAYIFRRIDRGAGQPVIESSQWLWFLTYGRVFK